MNDDLDPSQDLADQVLQLLQAAPDGLAEYALIQQLKARHSGHLPNLPLTDKLVLFRTLRDQLRQAQTYLLEISPLCIRLLPYQPGTAALSERDELRDYYLDMSQLRDTDERDVERLLTSFWTRMQGGDEKQAALELFELNHEQTLDLPRIKQRYRQMVSLHHPDRGGSTERLQSINLAMEILERYYR
jgi:hypothetical protein